MFNNFVELYMLTLPQINMQFQINKQFYKH